MKPSRASSPGTALQREARALGDPTRHAIFRYVADAGQPVGVAELTAHLGLNHNAIRQHLAKLLDAGLVVETRVRGLGPGRPPLRYSVEPGTESRWGVTGPYERLSLLLADVIRTGASPVEVGREAGRRAGRRAPRTGAALDHVVEAMAREGFQPEVRRTRSRVEVVLRACPFASTALADPGTVCALHLGIAEGVVEGTDVVVDELVRKDPRRAGCRLRLHVEPQPGGTG